MTAAAWVAIGGAALGTFFLLFPVEFWVETLCPQRAWGAGMPDCPVDSNDKRLVQAVLDGLESIEAHKQRLGQKAPVKNGKHATAEEGR